MSTAIERLRNWANGFSAVDPVAADIVELFKQVDAARDEVEHLRVLHRTDHGLADLRELERDNALAQRYHLEHELEVYRTRITVLEDVIRRVLADEESRPGGWGPDVTAVAWLRDALEGRA